MPNPPPGSRFAAIQNFLGNLGEPAYRFRQLVHATHHRGVTEFDSIGELPRRLRHQLVAEFGSGVLPLRPVTVQRGDQVEKALFETINGTRLETVRSSYRAGWSSLCLSTQAGCGLGCTFCATGAVGLVRNLTVDEICAQVGHPLWSENGESRVDSVAFMGMGEALANPHIFPALRMLTDPVFHGLSERRITISTVGFAPNLARVTREHPRVTLTLSVHSPYADQRATLIPLERRFPLDDNLSVLDEHVATTRRKTYLAYLLIAGVNDSADHLRALADLVRARSRPRLFQVSVIAYNEAAGVDPAYSAPTAASVESFVAGLHQAGVRATRRQQFGASIDAACGQLHARYLTRSPTEPDRLPIPVRRRAGEQRGS